MGGTSKARRHADPALAAATVSAMLERVRASGLKLTPQRVAIVRELAADPTHPTAQELFERLRPTLPTMSFATVYNTLDALASAGLCAALSLSPGASRFDPNMAPHHHAVCDRCGLVRDAAALTQATPSTQAASEASSAAPASAAASDGPDAGPRSEHGLPDVVGFEVRAVERIYRGLCASCARPRSPAEARPKGARA